MTLKKYLLFLFFFSISIQFFGQAITVDNTRTSDDLVNLLIGSSCAAIDNVNISSNQSVAYFNQNGSTFPISDGVIIRSGIATHTQGSYTGTNLDSQVNTNSDPDLQQISNASGQGSNITDVAFLEFDFVPPSNNFSFNFLFSSNEYGEWQCGFSDVFAFILTDLVTGEKINLAVIPASGNPISVKEIRDDQFNSSCNSVNPQLFGNYNVTNPATSAINMRGNTVVMNASATIKPNNPYKIKLVIGDYNDSKYDSAIFIEAGSFNNFLDLGDDIAICIGENTTLDSKFTNTVDYSYEWSKNNVVITGETNPTLSVNEIGTYKLNVTNVNTNCVVSETIEVTELVINNPPDLAECDNGAATVFDLTQNNIASLGLDSTKYSLEYFASLNNLNNNIPISNGQLTNYQSAGGTTIYGKVSNINSSESCTQIIDFKLNTTSVTATKPANFTVCDNSIVDLPNQVNAQILNGLNPTNHTILFFSNLQDAQNNTNPIVNPNQYNFPPNLTSFNIWARLSENAAASCFDITDFTVTVNPVPQIDNLDNVFACSSFTLAGLSAGNYFTGPNGTGTQLFAGDVITDTTSLYIYAEENGCSNQRPFNVTIVEEFTMDTEYCAEFIVPTLQYGSFYTDSNGPNGAGQLITPGTSITTDQTIYYYSDFDTVQCTDIPFNIIIHPLPLVDTSTDVTTCLTYTLPNLTNGNYFTGTNGTGTQLNAGDVISSTQTIYIYNTDVNTCTNESSFKVNIIDTTLFQNRSACGSYTIPNETIGGYFTQSGGQGTQLNAGDVITTSQTIYYFTPTDNGCADDIPVNITVNPLPPVDSLNDFITCVDNPMSLPALTNGNYFTQTGGQGTQLNAGDVITTSQTIYIYNFDGNCPNETNFTVEVRPLPPINSFTDIFSCEPYTLPAITNGKYFTQTGGTGTQLFAGDLISTTQQIFIYNEYDDLAACSNEAFFTIFILGVEVDKPADVAACDSYILPALTSGEYFTESGGQGTKLNAGDVISATQTLYVYLGNGSRFFCSDEHQFTITISTTPQLPVYPNEESCGSYTLPNLTLAGNVINYYRQPNKVGLINPSEYTITDVGTQTIYVHANAIGNENCSDETQFDLTIYPLLDLHIDGGIICVDSKTKQTTDPFLLQSGLDPAIFRVDWFFDNQLVGTGPNHSATKAGTYTVETTKLTPDIGADCNYKPTQVVVKASIPEPKVTFLTSSFTAPANIRIDFIEKGFGTYVYSLNNGSYQTSNLFHDLDFGTHTVSIKDTSGICSNPVIVEFKVINHSNFFTPNNDGENETWNISDLKNHPEAVVSIYDRFGKLVTQIRPSGEGWNGNYKNGTKAPSTDYWFTVTFLYQGKPTTYSSNFSLIRKE
ncbi:T9SS type B sorting domain-containing protein [Polaribacter uvawellassae]|uniref:T9SS type B sorting domain-containing protein n=1 Tax=Polaribacter uvawellassae TaxID=3133495 RepID=UPI00321B4F41